MFRVFVGFDPRQPISYTVAQMSIIEKASKPVSITPMIIEHLPMKRVGLTPFTYTRFLVPWLCGYEGWALFMDTDVTVLGDVHELVEYQNPDAAVQIVDFAPKYKFETASVMMFNCAHPDNRVLTPDYVDDEKQCRAPHTIDWTDKIGFLPPGWNVLVGYQPIPENAKLLHYTQGVPVYPETQHSPGKDAFSRVLSISVTTLPWAELMGPSVHVKRLDTGHLVPKHWPDDIAWPEQAAATV